MFLGLFRNLSGIHHLPVFRFAITVHSHSCDIYHAMFGLPSVVIDHVYSEIVTFSGDKVLFKAVTSEAGYEEL